MATLFSVLVLGGCLPTDLAACVCEAGGCDGVGSCWEECNDTCSCTQENSCALASCICGNGCVTDCGDCGGVKCGGLNRSCFNDCGCSGSGCPGCDDNYNCQLNNCECYGKDSEPSESGGGGCSGGSGGGGGGGSYVPPDPSWLYTLSANLTYVNSSDKVMHTTTKTVSSRKYDADSAPSAMSMSISLADAPTWDTKYMQIHSVIIGDSTYDAPLPDSFSISTPAWELTTDEEYFHAYKYEISVKIYVQEKYFGQQISFRFKYPEAMNKDDTVVNATVGGLTPSLPATPTFDRYEFLGWFDQDGHEFAFKNEQIFHLYDYSFELNDRNEVVVDAKFDIKPYKVKLYRVVGVNTPVAMDEFDVDYGTTLKSIIDGIKAKTYTVGDVEYKLGVDTDREEFLGWAFDAAGLEVISDATVVNKDISSTLEFAIYARYRKTARDPVTVRLHKTMPESNEVVIMTGTREKDVITQDSLNQYIANNMVGRFTFNGWFTNSSCTSELSEEELVFGNEYDFYAGWTEKTNFQVQYCNSFAGYKEGRTTSDIADPEYATYNYYKPLAVPTGANINNFTFTGWYVVGSDDKLDTTTLYNSSTSLPSKTFERDIVLIGVYTYDLTLRLEDGESLPGGATGGSSKVTLYYGMTSDDIDANILPVPVSNVAGKSFTGWKIGGVMITDGSGKLRGPFPTGFSISMMTFARASWGESTYTVEFKDSGNTVTTLTVTHGGTIGTLPEPLGRVGYTFKGWVIGDNELTADTVITGNKICSAKYEVNTYTMTLDANGGTIDGNATKEKEFKYNDGEGTDLGTPVRDGYIFVCWSDVNIDVNDIEEENIWMMWDGQMLHNYNVARDITLYAIWERDA